MTLSEYRTTHSWQQAIRLGSQLVRLAEQLPAAEDMGLSYQLRQSMVDLPAAIAQDLIENTQHRMPAAFRLVATLDLIEHVYPALDGAAAHAAVDQLVARLSSAQFAEQASGSALATPMTEGVVADLPNAGEAPAGPPAAESAAPVGAPPAPAASNTTPPPPPHAPAPTNVPAIGAAPIELPTPAQLAADVANGVIPMAPPAPAPMPAPAAGPAALPITTNAPQENQAVHVQPYSGQ
jgi:hypothetical protein